MVAISFSTLKIVIPLSFVSALTVFVKVISSKIFDFCNILDSQQEISRNPVALTVSADDKTMTIALFLVGAYMILCLDNDEPNSVFAAPFAE